MVSMCCVYVIRGKGKKGGIPCFPCLPGLLCIELSDYYGCVSSCLARVGELYTYLIWGVCMLGPATFGRSVPSRGSNASGVKVGDIRGAYSKAEKPSGKYLLAQLRRRDENGRKLYSRARDLFKAELGSERTDWLFADQGSEETQLQY